MREEQHLEKMLLCKFFVGKFFILSTCCEI